MPASSKKRVRAPDAPAPSTVAAEDAPASGGFGAAVSRILSRELHAAPSVGPVLAKRHTAAEKAAAAARAAAAEARERAKAARARAASRNARPTPLTGDAEKALRRIATAGVVTLFNAITRHQRGVEAVLEEAPAAGGRRRRSRLLAAVADKQRSFIDLLRGGGGGGGGGAAAGAAAGPESAPPPRQAWLRDGFSESAATKAGLAAAARADARRAEPTVPLLDAEDF
jgi:hypothetical protein